MTFAAVGAIVGGEGTGLSSFSLTPHAVNDLILIEVVCYDGTSVHPTALSSSNVTWSAPWTPFSGSTNPYTANVFMGKVTAASAATVTISFSGSVSGVVAWSGHEFSSTAGSWAADGSQGNLDSAGTASWPSLTPSAAGGIYFGYSFSETGSSSAGSTSGYTYSTNADTLGDCLAYNPACGSGATFPVWGSADQGFGIMVLVKETGGAAGAGDPAQIRPGRTWLRYYRPWVPQRPLMPPPDLAAPAPPPPPPSQDGPPQALPGPAWRAFYQPWRRQRPLMPPPSDPGVLPPAPPPPPAFPDVPLDLTCQLDLPADGWTDVTPFVYQRAAGTPVTITRGRPDESSQVNPSSAAFQLNNRDGRFTVKNPAGAYYGQLNRNTPVRFSVPAAGTNYLRLEDDAVSYASCPDTPQLDITGDTDIRIDLRLSSYVPCLLASRYRSGTDRAWALALNGDGTLIFQFRDSGGTIHAATSTVPVPLGRIALRVTIQVNSGSAGHTYTWYTAPSIGGAWTQLGSALSGGSPVTIAVSTAPAVIGYAAGYAADNPGVQGLQGAVYGFQLLNGIGGGVVASADFTAQPAGTTSFADGRGNTWTLSGTAEISGRDYRYHGEMASLPVTWDTSGKDVWTPVAAGGLLRRLGQGSAPVYSAMKRAILNLSGALAPVVYWPCEDLGGASSFGSAAGGPLMQIYGTPAFAADSAFACSAPLPTVNSSVWYGTVPAYTSAGSIVARFLLDVTSPPAGFTTIVRLVTTGYYNQIDFVSNGVAGEYQIFLYNTASGFAGGTAPFVLGSQGWVSLEAIPAGGGTAEYTATLLAPGGAALTFATVPLAGAVGNVTAVYVNPGGAALSAGLGHISVQSQWQSLFALASPLDAWQGETAGNRFARLCAENGLGCRIYGYPAVTAAMGRQGVSALTSLLQECESADLGMIYEPRQALALGYRTHAALLGQAAAVTLDYSAAVLGGTGTDLAPTYDDQYTRNDWTVQQGGTTASGGSYRAALDDGSPMSISPPDEGGVGDYSSSATANTASTSQLPDIAWWLVHLGTVDDFRWPAVPVNMARAAVAGVAADVQALDAGDRADIANPPGQLPPDGIRQLAAQLTEVLGGYRWTITAACIPESPYETGLYDDPVYGRADTGGSELQSGISSSAASLSVAATGPSGILWTTAAADFPFDIGIGGERMTVTGITGSGSPQTFTVVRSVNSVVKSHAAGDDVRLWFPPVYALQ